MSTDLTGTSRFLSYVLRHNPGSIGITLDDGGWIAIDELLAAAARHGHDIDHDRLDRLVNAPGKRRLEVRGRLIRAAQGHSIPVDLGLSPCQPPDVLYHGTVSRFLAAIMTEGLKPGQRRHVHLSADPATAARVGARRGQPVILTVDAAAAHRHGQEFFQAANGVWLTGPVAPEWIHPAPPR